MILGEVAGRIPEPDLEHERALHDFLAAAAERGLLRSAHDVGGGGLAVAVAESAMAGGIGVRVEEAGDLFGEGDGRVVVSARTRRRRRAAQGSRRACRCAGWVRWAAPRSPSARPGSRSPTPSRRTSGALPAIMDGDG